jgi:glycosyltransferase involved in cell wall biosynthesis
MQGLPKLRNLHRLYFPLYPLGVRGLDLSEYDLVITSSSGYAKGVKTRADAIHICYCHTPMRWVWRYSDYAERESFGMAARLILPALLHGLKVWDMNAARQPDQFVANSSVVADRIREIYHREAVVIPPPIDVDRFRMSESHEDFYLILSRLVPYKRIDLAIRACNAMNRRLVVIGDGPDRQRLQAMAGPTIEFKGRLSDHETSELAAKCRGLLFPGEEDFGMVPLELAAAGRPSIAFRAGGATETIIDGVTGLFFSQAEVGSLAEAIENFEQVAWNAHAIRVHALQFDTRKFSQRFSALLSELGVSVPVPCASIDSLPDSLPELADGRLSNARDAAYSLSPKAVPA